MNGVTRIIHQAGAAVQFIVWVALLVFLTLALV